jgi:hypothetical protein
MLTSISGVEFESCYPEKETIQIEELVVPVISLARLRENKTASGRRRTWPIWRIFLARPPIGELLQCSKTPIHPRHSKPALDN